MFCLWRWKSLRLDGRFFVIWFAVNISENVILSVVYVINSNLINVVQFLIIPIQQFSGDFIVEQPYGPCDGWLNDRVITKLSLHLSPCYNTLLFFIFTTRLWKYSLWFSKQIIYALVIKLLTSLKSVYCNQWLIVEWNFII